MRMRLQDWGTSLICAYESLAFCNVVLTCFVVFLMFVDIVGV